MLCSAKFRNVFIRHAKNEEFLGSLETNSYHFYHYDISYFAMYVNGK